MSFANSGANQLIQKFVVDYGNTGRTYQVIDFVRNVSNANTKVNLDQSAFLFNGTGGKLRTVRMNYFPILCDTEGDCDTQTLCSTGTKVEPKQKLFDIDRCIASKVYTIAKDDIRMIDFNTWDFRGTALEIINHAMPDFRRQIAIEWETLLYTMAGVHPDGNPVKRVSVTNPATGIINPMGRIQINRENLDAGFTEPYLLGGAEFYNWQQMRKIGGLNAQGQYVNQTDTDNVYYDDGLGDVILGGTGGHALSVPVETFKYVWYLNNAGIFRTDLNSINDIGTLYRGVTGGYLEGTLVDPVTNLAFDLYIKYDECDGEWNFWFKHTYNFFVMPDVVCAREGVNGIMRWSLCPQVIADCPTGTTPSPAVTPSTFSWTPGSIFNIYVATSTIGGVDNKPNVLVTNLTELAAMMNDAYGQIGLFSVSGSNIVYTGYTALTGNLNSTVTITFA